MDILAFLGTAMAIQGPSETGEFCSKAVNRIKNGFEDIVAITASNIPFVDQSFAGEDMVYW